AASVPALQGSPVTFAVDVNVLVIRAGLYGFITPNGAREVIVPVGVTVEWVIGWDKHTVTSRSAPPGGPSFDSGSLDVGERFQFVPAVAGTWDYFCRVHEETGTIIAR
ncbi:MAG: cupredoxin domain-containing protein, partial [Gemmatimonadota bacterium]